MDRHRSSHPTVTPSVCALVVLLVPILPMVTRSVVSADWELRFCVLCVCVCACTGVFLVWAYLSREHAFCGSVSVVCTFVM